MWDSRKGGFARSAGVGAGTAGAVSTEGRGLGAHLPIVTGGCGPGAPIVTGGQRGAMPPGAGRQNLVYDSRPHAT